MVLGLCSTLLCCFPADVTEDRDGAEGQSTFPRDIIREARALDLCSRICRDITLSYPKKYDFRNYQTANALELSIVVQ